MNAFAIASNERGQVAGYGGGRLASFEGGEGFVWQDGQAQLLHRRLACALQTGHANAQQPDRPWRIEPAEQLERDRAHPLGGGHGIGQRPGPGMGGEVV